LGVKLSFFFLDFLFFIFFNFFFIFLLLFICAYKAWFISPPCWNYLHKLNCVLPPTSCLKSAKNCCFPSMCQG
jgi:hypothetical protein